MAGSTSRLRAGVARVDITHYDAGPVNDPLYAKALVLSDGATTVALVTIDAVAIAEIGSIRGDFLGNVRAALGRDPGLPGEHVLVNVSHCHGTVCPDVEAKAVEAVRAAAANLVPVRVGVGRGHEDRISENRRLKLRDGHEGDVRHAYALAPDAELAAVGPIDPAIGLLRLDREDGTPLAVVFNFAVHPIQGVPSGANTADLSGFACSAIEAGLGGDATALFIQGCAGDVNPIWYKDLSHPRDSEPLGNTLGLSALRALNGVTPGEDAALKLVHERLALPRADLAPTIAAMAAEQARLVGTLRGTTLNLKGFLRLSAQYGLDPDFPAYDAPRYLHEDRLSRGDLRRLDELNRLNLAAYRANILTMEQLTRVQANLALLRMHQAQNEAAAFAPLQAELVGLRVGEFVLLTFPGELSVEHGLSLKARSPHAHTFVAGYTNGYLYYTPTVDQLRNRGYAQEDSDCLVAEGWQPVFDEAADRVLARL